MRRNALPIVIVFGLLAAALVVACGGPEPAGSTPTPAAPSAPEAPPEPAAQGPELIEATAVDFPDAESVDVAVAADGSVYVAMLQGNGVFVARSTDGGITFEDATKANLDATAAGDQIDRPALAVGTDGLVAVVWTEGLGPFGRIWYAASGDGGETFGPSIRVGERIAKSATRLARVGIVEGNNPIVAWTQEAQLRVTRSFDGGGTFGSSRSIERSFSDCTPLDLLVIGGEHALLAYRNLEDIRDVEGPVRDVTVLSTEDARRFLVQARAPDAPWPVAICLESGASLAYDGNTVYVSWMDARNSPTGLDRTDIWIASSSGGALRFSENRAVNTTVARHNRPSLSTGPGGRLHIAWEAREPDAAVVYYASSDDGGVTFTAPRAVASSNDGSGRSTPGFASLVVSQAGSIHVAWWDRLGGHVATWQDP